MSDTTASLRRKIGGAGETPKANEWIKWSLPQGAPYNPSTLVYAQEGGRVLVFGEDNLTRDEYGREVAPPKRMKKLPDTKGAELRDTLMRILAKEGVAPPVVLRTAEKGIPYGVEWRCAVLDGRTIVNIVNYAKDPVSIELPKGKWRDLIARREIEGTLQLATNTPVLIGPQ